MARGERLTIIIKKKDKENLEAVAEQDGITPSEFARDAINNRVKKALSNIKTHEIKMMKDEVQ